jgi:hypothetical protein
MVSVQVIDNHYNNLPNAKKLYFKKLPVWKHSYTSFIMIYIQTTTVKRNKFQTPWLTYFNKIKIAYLLHITSNIFNPRKKNGKTCARTFC